MATISMRKSERQAAKRFYWVILTAIVLLFALGFFVRSNNVKSVLPTDYGSSTPRTN